MPDRISLREVIADTVKLLNSRKAYVAGAFFPMLVVMAPLEWMGNTTNLSQTVPGGWWVFAALILVGTVLQAAVSHHFITFLRKGAAPAVPERLLAKTGKVLLKEGQVLAAVLIPGLLVLAVLMGGLFALHPGAAEGVASSGFVEGMQVVIIGSLLFGFCWPGVRIGAGIAGACVDEDVSLKDSWRMTKGYSLVLLFFLFPFNLVPLLTSWVLVPEGGAHGLFSPEMLLQSTLIVLLYLFISAGFSVWYVRLRERYEAMEPAAAVSAGEKISPFAVVREAVSVSWARKWTLTGVSVLGVMPGLFMLGMQTAYPDHGISWEILILVCAMVLGVFVQTMLNHTAVAAMRGKDDFFPEHMLLSMLRVFGRGLIIYVWAILPMVLGVAPFIIAVLVSGDWKMGVLEVVMYAVPAIVGWVVALVFTLRTSVMISGAATGRVLSVKAAFAMTRGHAWRMAGSLLMAILPVAASMTLFPLALNLPDGQGSVAGSSCIPVMLMQLLVAVGALVMFVTLPVWYEKLRLRQEGTAFVFKVSERDG